jgi:hypothetical protein
MSDGLNAKPSPSGPFDKRSGGLGVDRARAGAGKAPSRDPLPEGEGMGLAAAPGGNHLHSACKSRLGPCGMILEWRAAPTPKPSPSGRGLGEGVERACAGTGKAPSRHPHPNPPERLSKGPEGEEIGLAAAPGGKSPAFRLQIQAARCRLVPYRAARAMMPAGGNP